MKNIILQLFIFSIATSITYAQTAVTLTLTDENMALTNVGFKGAYGDWTTEQGYDDGTNGDATAGDFTHTIIVMASEGSYEWGAVNLDDNEAWLINGANRMFTVDAAGNVTGETSYTVPLAGQGVTILLTLDDTANQSLEGVSFKGSYGGWSSEPGYDDGTNGDAIADDNIWSLEVTANAGAAYEWGAENTGCTDPAWLIDGPNRSFDVAMDGTISGETSYDIPAEGQRYPVTFRVDMSNEIIESTGVYVSGAFQACAWNKAEIQMTETLPGIYEATTMVVPGVHQYKFFNGDCGDNGCQETADFLILECGVDNGIGGTNREIDLSALSGEMTLPIYVYNTCNTAVNTEDAEFANGFTVRPNPATGNVLVEFGYQTGAYHLQLINSIGQTVCEQTDVRNGEVPLNLHALDAGAYFVKLSNEEGIFAVQKLIVQ